MQYPEGPVLVPVWNQVPKTLCGNPFAPNCLKQVIFTYTLGPKVGVVYILGAPRYGFGTSVPNWTLRGSVWFVATLDLRPGSASYERCDGRGRCNHRSSSDLPKKLVEENA